MLVNPLANRSVAIRICITLLLLFTASTLGYMGGTMLVQRLRQPHKPCLSEHAFYPLCQRLEAIEEAAISMWVGTVLEQAEMHQILEVQTKALHEAGKDVHLLHKSGHLCIDQVRTIQKHYIRARMAIRTSEMIEGGSLETKTMSLPCDEGAAATYWDPRMVPEDW